MIIKVDGYIVLAHSRSMNFAGDWVLFGPMHNKEHKFESWPYIVFGEAPNRKFSFDTFTLEEARECKIRLLERDDIEKVKIAHIEMEIVESRKETEQFCRNKNLVVLGFLGMGITLFGRMVKDCPVNSYLYAGYLCSNGFKPARDYKHALLIAHEIGRQGQSRAMIGTFEIEFID